MVFPHISPVAPHEIDVEMVFVAKVFAEVRVLDVVKANDCFLPIVVRAAFELADLVRIS